MIIRYTRQALSDLGEMGAYLALERPSAGVATVQHVQAVVAGLREFPERGRIGRVAGTRELVVPRTPFIVAYRIGNRHIDILAVLHGARRWPSALGE